MPPLNDRDRSRLARMRRYVRLALESRPAAGPITEFTRQILTPIIRDIDEQIGTEDTEPIEDFDAALPDPEDDRWLYRPRGNPDQDVLDVLAKARAGRPLTPRERAIVVSVMPPLTSGAELMDAITVESAGEHPKDNPLPSERAARYQDCGEAPFRPAGGDV